MNVAYNHPPRTLQFYLQYILLLAVVLLPSIIVIPLLGLSLPIHWMVLLILGFIGLQLVSMAKPLLQNYILVEDTGVPKAMDISSLDLPIPDGLADIATQLEIEGFERFGEYEASIVGSEHPSPVWMYRSPKGHVLASLLEMPSVAFVGFTTFTENGIVETIYPRGHQLKLPNARYGGVRSSVDATYRHHIKLVREFIASGDRIVIARTIPEYFKLDIRSAPQSKVHHQHALIDHVISHVFLMIGILPGYLLMASWFLPGIYGRMFTANHLPIGVVMLVLGLVVANAIGWRSRGINGPKSTKSKSKR